MTEMNCSKCGIVFFKVPAYKQITRKRLVKRGEPFRVPEIPDEEFAYEEFESIIYYIPCCPFCLEPLYPLKKKAKEEVECWY